MTSFSAGHGRSHVVDSPPIYGIGRKRHFRTASWTAQFSNIFNSFSVLSAESESFENAMLPFASAVNGPIESREQRCRAHSCIQSNYSNMNKCENHWYYAREKVGYCYRHVMFLDSEIVRMF